MVAAAVGGLRTLVDDGVTGFLVHERDPQAFASHIGLLLDDEALAASMSEAAARSARRYTWATTAARLRRLYADLGSRLPVDCAV